LKESPSITVICDSHTLDSRLRPSAGFACLIKIARRNILFDTGPHLSTLLHNMEKLYFAPHTIDTIVLSHNDSDHAGALFDLLALVRGVEVYLLASSPPQYKDRVSRAGAVVREVGPPTVVAKELMSTGELGENIAEQALVLRTRSGLALIVGCGHPGLIDIIHKTQQSFGENPRLVLGGFHFGEASRSEIESTALKLQELGVKEIAPCHCTGERAYQVLKQAYGEGLIPCGSGKVIELA
jgi:7,8-dihydropterin-6-yl-methyl-4-(beta-D-ribofuranosyl)aminobenzene 5'-phosphate synthase